MFKFKLTIQKYLLIIKFMRNTKPVNLKMGRQHKASIEDKDVRLAKLRSKALAQPAGGCCAETCVPSQIPPAHSPRLRIYSLTSRL